MHKARFVIAPIATPSPVSNASKRLAEKGQHKLRAVHPIRATTECGRIGYAIRVFKQRRRFFPGAVFYKSAPQHVTMRQQAVMRIGERKQWKKSEGFPASGAATTTDRNPIMMMVVRLLAAASVADDRFPLTYRASRCELVIRARIVDRKLARSARAHWDANQSHRRTH
jgi:hypothetical protein